MRRYLLALGLACALCAALSLAARPAPAADDPTPPAEPVRLVFIHHSTGGNWLADPDGDNPYGGLALALMDNNYYVSATNYGWGPDGIGDRTDIPNWPEWFTGPDARALHGGAVRREWPEHRRLRRLVAPATDPGGENDDRHVQVVLPQLRPAPAAPTTRRCAEPDYDLTVANAKAVYNSC